MQNIRSRSKPSVLEKTITLKAIDRRIQEMRTAIDSHHSAMVSILGQVKTGVQPHGHSGKGRYTPSREAALKNVIREAIEVLEESRKAFKSRRLEVLRKKLTDALIDTDA